MGKRLNMYRHNSGNGRCFWAGLVAAVFATTSAFAMSLSCPQAAFEVGGFGSQDLETGPSFVLVAARSPMYLDASLRVDGGAITAHYSPPSRQSPEGRALEGGGRLVTIRPMGLPMLFDDLPSAARERLREARGESVAVDYERRIFEALNALLVELESSYPNAAFAVAGLGRVYQRDTIGLVPGAQLLGSRVVAFVESNTSIVTTATGQRSISTRSFESLLDRGGGRPVLFNALGGWRMLVLRGDLEGTAVSLEPELGSAEPEGAVLEADTSALAMPAGDESPNSIQDELSRPTLIGGRMSQGSDAGSIAANVDHSPGSGSLAGGGGGRGSGRWSPELEAVSSTDDGSIVVPSLDLLGDQESDSNEGAGEASAEQEETPGSDSGSSEVVGDSGGEDSSSDDDEGSVDIDDDDWSFPEHGDADEWCPSSALPSDEVPVLVPGATSPSTWAPYEFTSGGIVEENGSPQDKMFNERVIARFITPLFQDANSNRVVKVVAYAGGLVGPGIRNRVRCVDFQANGGAVLRVDEPITDEWGVEVYACRIPDDWQVKVTEIRAVVFPEVGKSRLLQGPWFEDGFADDLSERGVYLVRWDNVFFLNPFEGDDSDTGMQADAAMRSMEAVLAAAGTGGLRDVHVQVVGTTEERRLRLSPSILPPGTGIDPRNGVIPAQISGGILEISGDEEYGRDVDALLLDNVTIRQDPQSPGKLRLKNQRGKPYFQLVDSTIGYKDYQAVRMARDAIDAQRPQDLGSFLPSNSASFRQWETLFGVYSHLSGGMFVDEAVNVMVYRPFNDGCNAEGLGVNIRFRDVGEWSFPWGSVDANGDGTPTYPEVKAAFASGMAMDLGLWPDSVMNPLHLDNCQWENQEFSNAILHRIDIDETSPQIASSQGLFLSRNPWLYDVAIWECRIKHRSTASQQYGITIGHPGSGGWGSDLGPDLTHNVHVDRVDTISDRIADDHPWQAVNSYWWSSRAIDAETGAFTGNATSPCPLESVTPWDGPAGFIVIDLLTSPPIPRDWTGSF